MADETLSQSNIDIIYAKTIEGLSRKPKKKAEEKKCKALIAGTIGKNLYVITRKKAYNVKGEDTLLIYLSDCLQILKVHNGMNLKTYTILNKEKYRPLKHCVPITAITLSNLLIQTKDIEW